MSNAPNAPGTQSVDQDSLDRSLFQTLCITAIAALLLVLLFLLMRRLFPRLYAPGLFRETAVGKKWVSFRTWARPLFTVSDQFLFDHRGLDALMYMHFTRMMLALMIGFFFFGIVILWPVDGTSSNNNLPRSNPNYVNGTAILSMSNINSETQSSRYTAHVLSVIFNSILCYWLFVRTYNVYYHYSIKQRSRPDFSNYTILVDNVSRSLSEDDIFAEWNRQFPGEVLSVHRVYAAHKLHNLYLERCDIDDLRAAAEWDTDLSKRYEVYGGDEHLGGRPGVIDDDEELALATSSSHEQHDGVTLDMSSEKDKKAAAKAKKKQRLTDPPKMRKTKHCLPCACCCCCKPKIDVLEYAEERTEELNKKMEKEEKKMKPTPSVFISFHSRDAAVRAASTTFARKKRHMTPMPAPDFNDLRWHSFEYGHRNRLTRYILILILVAFVGLIFFIPVTFAQGLANIATLAEIPGFAWILPLSERYKTLTSLIEGILPALVLSVAFLLAKVFLKKIVLVERYFTRSNEARSFSSKYFYILVLNVFLASIAAGTFITLYNSVRDIVDDPLSFIRLLAARLPTQVNFFINYMAVNMVITNLIPLLQPVRFFLRAVTLHCMRPKTYTRRNWLRQFNWFHYHEEYPMQLLYFTITIAYSSLAPLIVPFALILFAVKYLIGAYLSLYVFKRRGESYGLHWPVVFNRLIVGMLLYQALMTGIFALNEFIAGIVLCAILMIVTLIYAIVMNRWYSGDLMARTVEIDPRYRKPDSINKSILAGHYRDPMRDWSMLKTTPWQTEGVWINSKDRLRQLQLSIDHPDYFRALQDQRMGFTQPTDIINTPEGLGNALDGSVPSNANPAERHPEFAKVEEELGFHDDGHPDGVEDTNSEDFVSPADEVAPGSQGSGSLQRSQEIQEAPVKSKSRKRSKQDVSSTSSDEKV